jgi:elongation factor P--(R)-beta-lysine ligase
VVHDYPASQAALARLKPGDPRLAERFEVFLGPIELANGYRELTSAGEQRQRFERDNRRQAELGRRAMPLDERFLAALEHGLPECAGVALGFDRLFMAALGLTTSARTMASPDL